MKIQNILKWIVLIGIFIIPFIPFVVSTTMLFPFITGKAFVFRILVEIVFVLFVILAIADKEYRPKLSLISKGLLTFTAVVLIADIFGENPMKSLWSNYERMEGFITIAHLTAYYFVISSVLKTEKWQQRFWDTSLLASVIMSIYGLLQVAGKITINQGGVRVDGTFGNASYLAIYLAFHFFIALFFLIKTQHKTWRYIYGVVMFLNVLVLYFTATRGAILGLIGGLIITGIIIVFKEKENTTVRSIVKWGLGALIVVIVLFFAVRNTNFVKESPVLSRFGSLSFSEIKTQGRYFVWPMAVQGFLDRPILGWGQENFNFVFNQYYNPAMYNQEQWFDRTHNVFLDWLIAGGVLGLASYLFIYFAFLYYLWKKTNWSVSEKAVLTGLLSAYLFHNIFVFDNLGSYILFFSLLGLVHSRVESQKMPTTNTSREFSFDAVHYGFLPAGIIVLVAIIYFLNIPGMSASKDLIKGMIPQNEGVAKNYEYFEKVFARNSFGSPEALEQLTSVTSQIVSGNFPDDIKQKFFNLAKTENQNQVARVPNDARYLLLYGSFLNRYSGYDEAIPVMESAIKNSPKKPAMFFELGTSYLGKKDYKKAFEIFESAYNLEPRYADAKIIYTIGAIYAGNKDVVAKQLSELTKEQVVGDDRFLRAYADIRDFTTVISILNERLKANPNDPQTNLSLAGAYVEMGNKSKAIELIRKVIKDNPEFKDQGEAYIKQLSQ